MFDKVEEAEAYAREHDLSDYLISKLDEQDEYEEFTWEIMPYGKHNLYKKLFTLYNKGLLKKLL